MMTSFHASHASSLSGSDTKKDMRSSLVSRNITVAGKRTSVRLEPEMWEGLREICNRERANLHKICTSVAVRKNDPTSLTAAIRVYVMTYFRRAATEDGHSKAGHGYDMTVNNARQTYIIGATPRPVAGYAAPQPMTSSSAQLHKRSFA